MDTTPTMTTFPTNGAKYIFTLDDIPVSTWAQRLQEFHSWMETQKLTRDNNYEILTEFVSKFTGVLRNWWSTVPLGDQMQFLVQQDFAAVIWAMHMHILGNPDDVKTLQRKEFFKRKCCSFEMRDLEKHFHTMIKLFFTLGADQSLKQQETFIALEELCDRKQIIKDYMSGSKELDKACKVSGLTIKCKNEPNAIVSLEGRFFAEATEQDLLFPPFLKYIEEDDDVESIFSIKEEPSDHSLFATQQLEEGDHPETEWSSDEVIYMMQNKISPTMASVVPVPHISTSVHLGKI
ncbi:hypothetical protein V6N11_050890 [Hibiscus sabdariffa]|uniref:Uncharacterized protein n=1 Tax=Hibiscus sabdariffa TaxID=183260 RepID=A0ABR2TB65_9ROSI